METAQKSFELQARVRQNAEIVQNTINDLFNWEKEIKDKEKKIQSQLENNTLQDNMINTPMPVRSHVKDMNTKNLSSNTANQIQPNLLTNGIKERYPLLTPSGEKQDEPKDPLELKHKEANEIKDRGNKHVRLLEYTKAIEAYNRAIELYNNDAVYYCNRALCYLKLERYYECIEDCDRAIEIDRLAAKAYYRRMMANESLGNNIDALKDCTTLLMITPNNREAESSLNRINERLRKNAQNTQGPNFSPLRPNMIDILAIDKPAYKRSTKPLTRLAVADVVGPNKSKNYENLTISDEDIDRLFNSNCGHFEEIKSPITTQDNIKTDTNVPKQEEIIKTKESMAEKKSASYKKQDPNKIEAASSNKKEHFVPPPPTSTAQFYSNWKELSREQKYLYLKSIPLKKLCKILGASFDSDTLSDIVNTLNDFYLLEKDDTTANTLLEVSKNEQVSILSLLMSNEERKVLTQVVNSLKETNSLDAASAEQIAKNFNLN